MPPDLAEISLNATKEWRDAANQALLNAPHGTQERCAEAAGCSAGLLSQLLSGQVKRSKFVGPISDFLGIPRPTQVALDAEGSEVSERYQRASPASKALVLALLRQLVPDSVDNDNG